VAEAGQDPASPAGLDARYEHLRHAVLHERAHAFPLGLGVLVARGMVAWARQLTRMLPPTRPAPGDGPDQARPASPSEVGALLPGSPAPGPDRLPPPVAAQLVHALAGLAVALAGT
jgi:hypothetical protein